MHEPKPINPKELQFFKTMKKDTLKRVLLLNYQNCLEKSKSKQNSKRTESSSKARQLYLCHLYH